MCAVNDGTVCTRFGLTPDPPTRGTEVGVAESALAGGTPLNGLRHAPEGNSNGWYVWSGDWSYDDHFFKPVHIEHIADLVPAAVPYLSLPPGWRFLLAPSLEDVWEDRSLLDSG